MTTQLQFNLRDLVQDIGAPIPWAKDTPVVSTNRYMIVFLDYTLNQKILEYKDVMMVMCWTVVLAIIERIHAEYNNIVITSRAGWIKSRLESECILYMKQVVDNVLVLTHHSGTKGHPKRKISKDELFKQGTLMLDMFLSYFLMYHMYYTTRLSPFEKYIPEMKWRMRMLACLEVKHSSIYPPNNLKVKEFINPLAAVSTIKSLAHNASRLPISKHLLGKWKQLSESIATFIYHRTKYTSCIDILMSNIRLNGSSVISEELQANIRHNYAILTSLHNSIKPTIQKLINTSVTEDIKIRIVQNLPMFTPEEGQIKNTIAQFESLYNSEADKVM